MVDTSDENGFIISNRYILAIKQLKQCLAKATEAHDLLRETVTAITKTTMN
jgi:hypothetical protein